MALPGEIAVTTAELSHIMRLSKSSIKRMRAAGEIRGHKFRRQLRFFVSEVLADVCAAESDFELRRSEDRLIRSGKKMTPLKGKLGIHDYNDEPNGGCDY